MPLGTYSTAATLEGGGAARAATATESTRIDPQPATFAILPQSFVPDFFAADGLSTEREAGGHPDLFTVPFDLSSVDAPTTEQPGLKRAAGSIRHLTVDTPPGFVGSPTAIGECSEAEFTIGNCPASSQVGRIDLIVYPFLNGSMTPLTTGVFNLSHPRGVISDLGFVVARNPVHIKVSLDPANHYAIRSTVPDINEALPDLTRS